MIWVKAIEHLEVRQSVAFSIEESLGRTRTKHQHALDRGSETCMTFQAGVYAL